MSQRIVFKNAQVEKDKLSARCPGLLTKQSKDTAGIVASFLNRKDVICLSKTCNGAKSLFSHSVNSHKTQHLLQAVVYGNYERVDRMLKDNPELLLEKGTVTDYSGRIHANRTAYQLALGACDIHVKDAHGDILLKGMVEMIESHFGRLPGKSNEEINAIMLSQYKNQFPDDYEGIESERCLEDSAALHCIFNTLTYITQEECTAVSLLEETLQNIIHTEASQRSLELNQIIKTLLKATTEEFFDTAFDKLINYITQHQLIQTRVNYSVLLKALYQFRCYLEPKESQTIGKHFNHMLLSEAAHLYELNYQRFGEANSRKNLFCWQKVFGYIERFLPACDAQCIAGRVWSSQFGQRSHRTLEFYCGGEYYPLDLRLDRMLGYNCALDCMPDNTSSPSHVIFEEHPWRSVQNLCGPKALTPQLCQYEDAPQLSSWCSIL